jgi:hypothetical protein
MNTMDKFEDDPEKSCECIKVVKYSGEKTADDSVEHKCLLEWNDLNRS